MRWGVFFVLMVFLCSLGGAHIPRFPSGNLTVVSDPGVSQAFYSELPGSPMYYLINSSVPFTLYVSLLVPDVEGVDRDVSAEILSDGGSVVLNGSSYNWSYFFEEFAGDGYFQGPSFEEGVDAGVYLVRVFSPDNRGKYVFVVGRVERFSLGDWVDTVVSLPGLKRDFFDKPWYTAFFNLIGLFLFFLLLALAVLVFLIKRYFM